MLVNNKRKLFFLDDEEAPHIYHKLMAVEGGFDEQQLESFYEVDATIARLKCLLAQECIGDWPSHIFVDINMPHKSGYDFVEEIVSVVPDKLLPSIFFVSSTKNPNDIERVASIDIIKGFETKFLEKPFFENLLN